MIAIDSNTSSVLSDLAKQPTRRELLLLLAHDLVVRQVRFAPSGAFLERVVTEHSSQGVRL
jgi:hypothetical protein